MPELPRPAGLVGRDDIHGENKAATVQVRIGSVPVLGHNPSEYFSRSRDIRDSTADDGSSRGKNGGEEPAAYPSS